MNSVDELSIEQQKELKGIYQSYINQLSANVCLDEGC